MTVGPEFATEIMGRLGGSANFAQGRDGNPDIEVRRDATATITVRVVDPSRVKTKADGDYAITGSGPSYDVKLPKKNDKEIDNVILITPDKVREIIKASREPVSLETPIGDEADGPHRRDGGDPGRPCRVGRCRCCVRSGIADGRHPGRRGPRLPRLRRVDATGR